MAKAIKSLLSEYFSHQKEHDWKIKLLQDWPLIMGNLADHVKIYKIYQNAITLHVKNSSWMQEMHCLSNVILDKINGYLGNKQLVTLYFKVISYDQEMPHKKKEALVLQPQETEKKSLSLRQKKALNSIQDKELSQALESFLQRCLK